LLCVYLLREAVGQAGYASAVAGCSVGADVVHPAMSEVR
jgi:hypothetical protein